MKIHIVGGNRHKRLEPKDDLDFFCYYNDKKNNIRRVNRKEMFFYLFYYIKFRPKVILLLPGIRSSFVVLLKKLGLIRVPLIHMWNDDYRTLSKIFKHFHFMIETVEKFNVLNSDINFTPSKFREKKGKDWGARITFIPHGVIEEFDKISPSIRSRKRIRAVYGGKICKEKGVEKIFEIAEKNPLLDLFLFGDCSHTDIDLKKRSLRNNLFLMGQVTHKELIANYKSADVLILSGDNDSALKMWEYIKSGKPILALNNQVKYVLEHKKTAYLAEDLGEGLRELVADENLRKRISKNLNKFKIYTWKEVSERYLNEMKKIIRRRR